MLNVVKIISDSVEGGRRFLKFLRFGKRDIQTAYESLPPGVDAVPIKDMKAIFGKTESNGKTVIIGYINTAQISKSGEIRIFATDKNGSLKRFIHLKDDNTIEFGGTSDNLVRFLPLQDGLDSQRADINNELVKIAVAINAIVPDSYTPTSVSVDISGAKIDDFKSI